MSMVVLSLGAFVLICIFLAICARFYLNQGNMSGLLSEAPKQGVRMLRFQYLIFSVFGAGIYLFIVFTRGEFLPIPDVIIGSLGLSSVGYLSGKGLDAYRIVRNKDN